MKSQAKRMFFRPIDHQINWQKRPRTSTDELYLSSESIQQVLQANPHGFDGSAKTKDFFEGEKKSL